MRKREIFPFGHLLNVLNTFYGFNTPNSKMINPIGSTMGEPDIYTLFHFQSMTINFIFICIIGAGLIFRLPWNSGAHTYDEQEKT